MDSSNHATAVEACAVKPPISARREFVWLAAILGLILLANLITATRSPTVWKDEVFFLDPAINYIRGEGLISRAWSTQPTESPWASNAPLHVLLLIPWVKTFGFNPLAVRSLPFVYITGAAMLLWLAVRRAQWLRSPLSRIALILLFMCGFGISFSYRSARYDAIGILLLCGIAAAWTIRRPRVRLAAIAAIAMLLPWTGFQLVAFVSLMGVLLVLCFGMGNIRNLLAVGVGGAVGGCLYYAYLVHTGGLYWLVHSIRSHASSASSPAPPGTRFLASVYLDMRDVFFQNDYSFSIMILLFLWILIWRRGGPWRVAVFGLASVTLIPLAIDRVFYFPTYYTWMAFVPLCIATLALWERSQARLLPRHPAAGTIPAIALLVAAMLIGLPLRLGLTVLEWQSRDFERANRAIISCLRPGDVAFVGAPAYYAARSTVHETFFDLHVPQMTAEEKQRVSVLVVPADPALNSSECIPGDWQVVGELHPPANWLSVRPPNRAYDLLVYRRRGAQTQPGR